MNNTLLTSIALCATLLFACKKDDDGNTDPNGGNGGGNNPQKVSCKYNEEKRLDANGNITYGYKYHYSNNKLDSATPLEGLNLFSYIYTYPEEGKRKVEYSYNGQLFDSYSIEAFNEYGEIITEDSYDGNDNALNSRINEYECDLTSKTSSNKYCRITKTTYYDKATNTTTITDFYYTGDKLDSSVTDNGYKKLFEYTDDNTRKVQEYEDGVKKENYSVEKVNEYGKITEKKYYNESDEYTGESVYDYRCD